MELTREQREAAEAGGCVLLPATDLQVGRLAAQRRIFLLDGRPHVARRADGFLETHGTLARLIEAHLSNVPRPVSASVTEMSVPQSPPGDTAGEPAEAAPPPTPSDAMQPEPDAPSGDDASDEPETTEARATRPVRRRAGQPKPPRWATAGAIRRGRPPRPR